MQYVLENGQLTLFLKGDLNSYTAEDTEKEIEEIVLNNKFDSLVINMKDLNYISSAGIRIIVRLKQKYENTSLIKVPTSINDIFVMVGLDTIINIEKL